MAAKRKSRSEFIEEAQQLYMAAEDMPAGSLYAVETFAQAGVAATIAVAMGQPPKPQAGARK
jgi:hypothetical protein